MRNKIIDIYQSGEGYRPGMPVNHGVSHYLQKEKIWNLPRSDQLTKMTPKMASMGEFKEENQDLKGPRA